MGKRSKLPPADPMLVAELRQIEADWRARSDAGRSKFRDEWTAKMATARSLPKLWPSTFRPNR